MQQSKLPLNNELWPFYNYNAMSCLCVSLSHGSESLLITFRTNVEQGESTNVYFIKKMVLCPNEN